MEYLTRNKEYLIRKHYERNMVLQAYNPFSLYTNDQRVIDALDNLRKNKGSDLELKKLL